ncbi:MAG TPA: putative 2OG-Fe(II) oxygenase [Solirubrobacteraceae bacterium]|nr:putative 2OG-Fe(II) oxygenase [Solirubrobacteraceae bacterium]
MAKTRRVGHARRSQSSTTAPRPAQAQARSTGKPTASAIQRLWPTPIGLHRYGGAAKLNPVLVDVFAELRAEQQRKRGEKPGAFFASDDDLLDRVKVDGWQDFVRFIVQSVGETARKANGEAWAGRAFELGVNFEGMWFQCSRDGAFHDVHTHGNCSWSSAYIVQIDDPEQRVSHPVYGAANGVTRLYSPHTTALGGAFVDVGNAYLLPPHQDIDPVPGQLLLFPSWLAHQAMPYGGEKERVIISFNASLHAAGGNQLHGYSAH